VIKIGVVQEKDYEEVKNFLMKQKNHSPINDNCLVMAAKERDELLAVGIVNLQDDYAVLEDIIIGDNEGFQLEYAMGKALLNAVDLRGILHVFCINGRIKKLLIKLGFTENIEGVEVPDLLQQHSVVFYLNLFNYFTNHSCQET